MQTSKLQTWCEGVIEAGWLAALIVAPLFFNVYSSRVFEPDKISLVRSIALIMLLAYLVKLADGGRAWLPAQSPDDLSPESTLPWYRRFLRLPFLLPLLLLVAAYLLSTLLSVAPSVSWWGSYQRLQGTYSFLSYIIIAVLTAAHLRRPEQLRRLQHTVIIASIPASIYGIIQHFDIDPLPWGGDVVTRVSANAGNPIFLGAYLIMAFFLTLERIFSSFAHLLTTGSNGDAAHEDGVDHDMPSALAGGSYLFILIVQIAAVFWTQSRGPWLGLFGGMYLFVLLLLTGLRPKNYRAWTAGWVGMGVLGAVFLVLINVTPLGAPLRSVPYLGRLTTMLDTGSGTTGLVRVLIWEGVAEMVTPHDALLYPDGTPDPINPIRPLVGYGPEAMWVAYNNFYPPQLAQVEARNASPDRSHNETWDSLAITGGFGFVAYVFLFITIFYWSLRWLGLITRRRDFYLFSIFWLGGGALLSTIFYFYDGSWRFFGVALPTGFILGLIAYITLAVFMHPDARIERGDRRRQLLIVAILATITAHYIEIHFGIAIASTRTYFWVMSALLLTVGMRWLMPEPFANTGVTAVSTASGRSSAQMTRLRRRRNEEPSEGWLDSLPATVMPDLLVMMTTAFLYTTNFEGLTNPFAILFRSLVLRSEGGRMLTSPGILALLIFTWLIASTVGLAVAALQRAKPTGRAWWLRGYALYAAMLWGGWLIYGLIQAGRLVPQKAGTDLAGQLNHIANHFTLYTWLVIIWAAAAGLVFAWPLLREQRALLGRAIVSVTVGSVLAIIIFVIVGTVNVALVRADIFYKQGQQFDSNADWVGSVELYRRALAVRPTEDHYMLFLGRSLLEQAKRAPADALPMIPQNLTVDDVLGLTAQQVSQMGRADLLRAAETILVEAQRVNPLNTDHTANLARLYRSWADMESADGVQRTALLEKSLERYREATTLSPNAAHLWNEMGGTLSLLGRGDEAEETFKYSLSLDDRFETTYLLLAELYDQQGRDEELKTLLEAGVDKVRTSAQIQSYLGVLQARSGDLDDALETNLALVERNPNDANAVRNLIILYRDREEYEEALAWSERGIALGQAQNMDATFRTDMHRLRIDIFNRQGNTEDVLAEYEAMQQLNPTDVGLLSELTNLYLQKNQPAQAAGALQRLGELQPENYIYPFQLAQLYQSLGQTEDAIEAAQRAQTLAPADQKSMVEELLAQLGG